MRNALERSLIHSLGETLICSRALRALRGVLVRSLRRYALRGVLVRSLRRYALGNILVRSLRRYALGNILVRSLRRYALRNILIHSLRRHALGDILVRSLRRHALGNVLVHSLRRHALGNILRSLRRHALGDILVRSLRRHRAVGRGRRIATGRINAIVHGINLPCVIFFSIGLEKLAQLLREVRGVLQGDALDEQRLIVKNLRVKLQTLLVRLIQSLQPLENGMLPIDLQHPAGP